MLVVTGARAAAPAQKSFATPDDAVNALVQAVKARDRNAMLAALGNAGDWLSSGDATADKRRLSASCRIIKRSTRSFATATRQR